MESDPLSDRALDALMHDIRLDEPGTERAYDIERLIDSVCGPPIPHAPTCDIEDIEPFDEFTGPHEPQETA